MAQFLYAFTVLISMMMHLAAALQTDLINHCGVDIFWRASSGLEGDTDSMERLRPNEKVTMSKDPVSLAIKINKSGDWASVLIAEANLDGPGLKLHYNWSDEKGNDFLNDHRGMYFNGNGGCQDLVCEAGSRSCDWTIASFKDCTDPGYAAIVIC